MKILITENKFKDILKLSIKKNGTQATIDNVGDWENFCKVLNIKGPMDFLHLFDDLEQFQSEENKDWTLFCYKKGYNFIIYDRKIEIIFIDYDEIWSFLSDNFGLNDSDIEPLTQKWLDEVYNLKGIITYSYWRYIV